jgi:hypothetical protein
VGGPCTRTHRPSQAAGAAAIRHRALLCFSDEELRLDAGEALGSIEPRQRFPGRKAIVRENFHGTVRNVNRSLRLARQVSDAETRPTVARIARLARAGIHRIQRHPSLVVHGGIGPFLRADAIARRAGLRHCLS